MKTDDDTVLSLDRLAVLIHKLEREEEVEVREKICCDFVHIWAIISKTSVTDAVFAEKTIP